MATKFKRDSSTIEELQVKAVNVDLNVSGVTATNVSDGITEVKGLVDNNTQNSHMHSNKSVIDTITSALITNWNSAYIHVGDAVKHITSNERNLWNTVSNKLDSSANAVSATKLETAKTLSLTGDINGSTSFDGSTNTSITAMVVDDSHNHNINTSITGNLPTNRLDEPSYVLSSITKTARPLFDVLRGDRTAFLPATQIIIEKSTDAGITWVDAGITDIVKRQLFTGQRPSISIPLKNGVRSTDCMIRITITGMRYNVPDGTAETNKYNYWNHSYIQSTERYFTSQEGWTWVNSISDRIYLKVEKSTGINSTSWSTDREAYLSGWAGGNYFSLSGNTFGGGTNQTSNYWNWRFTFRTCSNNDTFNDTDLATTYTTSAQSVFI